MVCTAAYSAGNDYPEVRVVFHAGAPASIVEYSQETGRGGRDGRQSICIVAPESRKA